MYQQGRGPSGIRGFLLVLKSGQKQVLVGAKTISFRLTSYRERLGHCCQPRKRNDLEREAWMSSVVSIQQNAQRYNVVGPDPGDQIEIPKELFKALWDFSQGSKATGSVVIHFRNGGVAGLEAVIKRTYK